MVKDKETWRNAGHGVTKSQTQLSDWTISVSEKNLKKYIYIYIYIYAKLGEGNGNPLQYSCQENPVDRGAW